MMGYTEQDIDRMKSAVVMAGFYLPPSHSAVGETLQEVNDFLDGLLAEGRI